jgi:site-specific recombinase XerD
MPVLLRWAASAVVTDIETFARDLEAKDRARATVTRRLSTIAGFYKYAVGRLVREAAEQRVGLNRLVSDRLARALSNGSRRNRRSG